MGLVGLLPLHVHADRPDEAEELAPDRGNDLWRRLPFRGELAVARMQPVLRLPGEGLDLLAQPALVGLERAPDPRAVSIGMRRLQEDAAQVRIARLGKGVT